MGLAETAQFPEDGGTPHEHAAGQVAARGGHRPVQHGQTLLAAAGPREGRSQGRLHVDLTLGPAGRAGQPQALLQLGDRFREVAAIAQDDTDRVVRQRGVVRAGPTGQHGTRGEQRIVGPGHSERQQLGRIGRHVLCIRISRFHSDNARQFPTPNKGKRGSMTVHDEGNDERRRRLHAQVGLILSGIPGVMDGLEGAVAHPADWADRGEVDYHHRDRTLLVRDADVDRVTAVVPGAPVAHDNNMRGLTRLELSADERRTVEEACAHIDRALGEGVATPDHVLYVCPHHGLSGHGTGGGPGRRAA